MSPDDDLDDPWITRYADRVDDEVEVLWRSDFARLFEDPEIRPAQASAIRDRWSTDPQVAPRWRELDEIREAWTFAPEAMRHAHEVTMPGGLRPPGMDQPRWASHMQAREMTGHGYWPGFEPTYSSSFERHEPMTNTTPAHVLDSETESDIERQMRTDYELSAKSHNRDPQEYDPADSIDAHSYASPWMDNPDHRYMHEWIAIGEAEELWRRDPDAAATQLAAPDTAPLQRRHLEQGRDLARGIYTRDVQEVDYVADPTDPADTARAADPSRPYYWHGIDQGQTSRDSSRNAPGNPVPAFGARVAARTQAINAFRDTASSVNAFAAVGAERERDEMER
ncbi:hypothetical protein ACIO52_04575 [Nocardia sp. NPDC087230]|uniref:hypothetical protein n=1 Tax=Nocardia sp. NPDC087230 TaxID=3364331 RepID=UPI0037FDD045